MNTGGTLTNSSVDLSLYSALGIGNFVEILPIQLLSFTAQKYNNDHNSLIQWSTASETNNNKFIVERSADLIEFTTIGEQNGAGNSHVAHDYSLVDAQPLNGVNYYRLKQVNFDGTFEYSNIVSLSFDNQNAAITDDEKVDLLNSMTDPALRISVPESWSNTTYSLAVYNEAGQIIQQFDDFTLSSGSTEIKTMGNEFAEHGFYVAVLSNVTQKRKKTFKIIR